MNNDIFSLIDAAKEQMKRIGLADATIETYQQRSFNQIIQRYQKEGDYQYRQEIMHELLTDAEQQFFDGMISRKTRNWRRRGIKVLQELFQSGSFQWKMYPKSSSDQFPKLFEETISSFMESFSLRPNEGREIRRDDIDTDNRTLFIRENKTHKERLIPMAEDVAELCSGYISKRDILFPDSEYLFPSPDGSPYPAKWLTRHFLYLWRQASPQDQYKRVRVYDLRHRFATAVLMDWLDKGEDLYTALPYLSAYMGHSDFKDILV